MTTPDLINNIISGGLLGMLGQGIRVAVGLKKFNEENSVKALEGKNQEPFSTSRLLISIFIGFVAGALGMIIKAPDANANNEREFIITIIAIGYSGADFIEGVFNTYINKATTPQPLANTMQPTSEQPLLVQDESTLPSTPAQG